MDKYIILKFNLIFALKIRSLFKFNQYLIDYFYFLNNSIFYLIFNFFTLKIKLHLLKYFLSFFNHF